MLILSTLARFGSVGNVLIWITLCNLCVLCVSVVVET
jgi:hypothetical protein